MYEGGVMKTTKYCLKKGKRKKGGLSEYNSEAEIDQSTLYTSREISQRDPLCMIKVY
jgi:hypothetical protein